jgi:ubiquinone/menaquinone biosynthesis C-methylase UbiE
VVEPSDQIKGIEKLFDSISDSYDAVGVDFFQPIASGLVDALKPANGEFWLDIGCGRGAVAEHVSPFLGARGKLLGFDISDKMIQ